MKLRIMAASSMICDSLERRVVPLVVTRLMISSSVKRRVWASS